MLSCACASGLHNYCAIDILVCHDEKMISILLTYLLNILNPCFRFSCTFFTDCWITLGDLDFPPICLNVFSIHNINVTWVVCSAHSNRTVTSSAAYDGAGDRPPAPGHEEEDQKS